MATRSKRRTTTPSMSKLGDDDLLVEVLCRIRDPKTAFRCKSVYKRWNSLISAPYFSRRFRSHHHHRLRSAGGGELELPPLLISSAVRGPFWSFLPLPSETRFMNASVVDCFKDLLLVEFADCSSRPLTRSSYLVCNPFTKQWVALPPATETDSTTLARLVCKPLDSGVDGSREEEEEPFTDHHFEYRFLVVRLHRWRPALDVFCSESGRWTEVALDVSIRPRSDIQYTVVSLNGKLYWKDYRSQVVVGWNPFSCLDDESDNGHISPLAPTLIGDHYWLLRATAVQCSQGALHVIYPTHWRSRDHSLIVWRLLKEEEAGRGCRRWTRRYEVPLNKLIGRISIVKIWKTLEIRVVGQHLDKAEVIFLQCRARVRGCTWPIFSCNLETEEIEPLVCPTEFIDQDSVFQPRVTLWPNPIPNYQKLRDSYDGRYSCWLQRPRA